MTKKKPFTWRMVWNIFWLSILKGGRNYYDATIYHGRSSLLVWFYSIPPSLHHHHHHHPLNAPVYWVPNFRTFNAKNSSCTQERFPATGRKIFSFLDPALVWTVGLFRMQIIKGVAKIFSRRVAVDFYQCSFWFDVLFRIPLKGGFLGFVVGWPRGKPRKRLAHQKQMGIKWGKDEEISS